MRCTICVLITYLLSCASESEFNDFSPMGFGFHAGYDEPELAALQYAHMKFRIEGRTYKVAKYTNGSLSNFDSRYRLEGFVNCDSHTNFDTILVFELEEVKCGFKVKIDAKNSSGSELFYEVIMIRKQDGKWKFSELVDVGIY